MPSPIFGHPDVREWISRPGLGLPPPRRWAGQGVRRGPGLQRRHAGRPVQRRPAGGVVRRRAPRAPLPRRHRCGEAGRAGWARGQAKEQTKKEFPEANGGAFPSGPPQWSVVRKNITILSGSAMPVAHGCFAPHLSLHSLAGETLRTIATDSVKCLALSPDGFTLVAISKERVVRLWKTSSGTRPTPFHSTVTDISANVGHGSKKASGAHRVLRCPRHRRAHQAVDGRPERRQQHRCFRRPALSPACSPDRTHTLWWFREGAFGPLDPLRGIQFNPNKARQSERWNESPLSGANSWALAACLLPVGRGDLPSSLCPDTLWWVVSLRFGVLVCWLVLGCKGGRPCQATPPPLCSGATTTWRWCGTPLQVLPAPPKPHSRDVDIGSILVSGFFLQVGRMKNGLADLPSLSHGLLLSHHAVYPPPRRPAGVLTDRPRGLRGRRRHLPGRQQLRHGLHRPRPPRLQRPRRSAPVPQGPPFCNGSTHGRGGCLRDLPPPNVPPSASLRRAADLYDEDPLRDADQHRHVHQRHLCGVRGGGRRHLPVEHAKGCGRRLPPFQVFNRTASNSLQIWTMHSAELLRLLFV